MRYRVESFGNGLYGVWSIAAAMYVRPVDSKHVTPTGWFTSYLAAHEYMCHLAGLAA